MDLRARGICHPSELVEFMQKCGVVFVGFFFVCFSLAFFFFFPLAYLMFSLMFYRALLSVILLPSRILLVWAAGQHHL